MSQQLIRKESNNPKCLQAQLEFQERACEGYSIDFTIGCEHNCVYCHFTTFQKMIHRRRDKTYRGGVISLAVSELLEKDNYPPQIYLSWSSDPFAPKARDAAHAVLQHLLPRGVRFIVLTKGIIPDNTVELLEQYGSQIAVQVGIANLDENRNRAIEPGTATVQQRLALLAKLAKRRIGVVAARIDPLFPGLDDGESQLFELLRRIHETGTRNIVASYIITSRNMTRRMSRVKILREPLRMLTETTPSVAPMPVFSVSYQSGV